jgi:integrase
VHASNWNNKTQQSNDPEINNQLYQIKKNIDRYIEHCRKMDKPVFKSDLKDELNFKLGRKVKKRINHFYENLDGIIEDAKSGKLLTPKSTKYAPSSIINFIKTRKALFAFNPNLEFSTITLHHYNEFLNYCTNKNYTPNYIGSFIKEWKTLMNIGAKRGYHNNLVHKHPDFKKPSEESHQIYLNEEEIDLLYQLDLTKNNKQEIIRDRFIINLYTGLRVSDMNTLNLKNFYKGNITHINKKTNKKVVIPIHPRITAIINKYGGELPKLFHQNTVNTEIKSIARKAGIRSPVHFSKTYGGVKQQFLKEKWEMVSNHTCRRSLTSNLLKYTDAQSVMPVVGMTMKTLQLYNKRSPEENAEMLANNKFFNEI